MKVGKEGIASVIAALDAWRRNDWAAVHADWTRRAALAADALAGVPGLRTVIAPDLPGSPLHRTRIHVADAAGMADVLAGGEPSIRVWRLGLTKGYFELDPRMVSDREMADICRAIRAIAAARA
jgi:L-seryl-tRNA(Ser) seleniumtransferase